MVEVLEAGELREDGNMAKIDNKTREKMLLCPRCKIGMKKLIKNYVVLDICTKCKGMWVDNGELHKLAKIANNRKT